MSRIGNRILTIPKDVTVSFNEKTFELTAKGPKGTLTKTFGSTIKIIVVDNTIKTQRFNEQKQSKQLHGTINSLISGMLTGVHEGFNKTLIISGIGYRAKLIGQKLELLLGFSHKLVYESSYSQITLTVDKPTIIKVSGIDKQEVGQVAAEIRAFHPPEPYKAKGIKYKNESIIRKEGKSSGK